MKQLVIPALLLQNTSVDDFTNRLRILIEGAIKKEVEPLKKLLMKANDVNIERHEAAKILGVTPATINNYAKTGRLIPVFNEDSSHQKYKLLEVLALKKED
jgi:hypothetical protein